VTPDDAERAFTEFARTHSTRALSYALFCCNNRPLAEDTVQEAFVRTWKAGPNSVDQISHPYAYLRRTIRNLLVDFHRTAQRRLEEVAWEDERDGQLPDSCNVAEEATFRAMGRDLKAAVATLEEIQQDLIYYIYYEQFPIRAASRTLGLTETTARRYHQTALSRLREIIGCDSEEDQDSGR